MRILIDLVQSNNCLNVQELEVLCQLWLAKSLTHSISNVLGFLVLILGLVLHQLGGY